MRECSPAVPNMLSTRAHGLRNTWSSRARSTPQNGQLLRKTSITTPCLQTGRRRPSRLKGFCKTLCWPHTCGLLTDPSDERREAGTGGRVGEGAHSISFLRCVQQGKAGCSGTAVIEGLSTPTRRGLGQAESDSCSEERLSRSTGTCECLGGRHL